MSQTHPRPDSEDALEQAVMELFTAELGWDEVVSAYSERVGTKMGAADLGRETEQEVVLRRYLLPALARAEPRRTARGALTSCRRTRQRARRDELSGGEP